MGVLGVLLILCGIVGWGWVAAELATSLYRGADNGFALIAAGAAFGGFAAVLAAGASGLFVAGVALVAAAQVRADLLRATERATPAVTAPSAAVKTPPTVEPQPAPSPTPAAASEAQSPGDWGCWR